MLSRTAAIRKVLLVAVLAFSLVFTPFSVSMVSAAPVLPAKFIRISSPNINDVAEYTIGLTINETVVPLGSIEFTFCSNSPIIVDVCTQPSGLDVSGAVLINETGNSGFAISASTPSTLLLSRVPILPVNASSTYSFEDITNPDTPGSYYLRIKTFSSTDGTGAHIEEGGAVFSMNGGVSLLTEVPPYLRLCASVTIVDYNCATATSFLIDFGEFSKTSARTATSELVIATNAGSGFSISISGTTLTSGNNIIAPLASGGSTSPGTAQFGINLRANSSPSVGSDPVGPGAANPTANYNVPNTFRFAESDVIVSGSGPSDHRKFTVSYLANIDPDQPPGIYTTTITYIALANF